MAFRDIKGQDPIVKYLQSILTKERIPPTLLFVGRSGTGRFLTAKTFAKALNCPNVKNDCCDKCKSCIAIQHNVHPNVNIIGRNKDVIKIEDIRSMINSSFIPVNKGYRVNIIDNIDKATIPAFNSMLKYLEEPPEHTVNILIAEITELLPETIKSRAVELKFKPLNLPFIKEAVKRKGLSDEDAEVIARIAKGSMKNISSLCSPDFLKKRRLFIKSLLGFLSNEVTISVLLNHWNDFSISNNPKEKAKSFFDTFSTVIQDILLVSVSHDTEHITNIDFLGYIANRFAFVKESNFRKIYKLLKKKESALLTNANPHYILLDGLFQIKEVIR